MFKMTPTVIEQDAEVARNRRWSAWIRRCKKGDIDAFAALYDESSTVVFGLVLQILQDRESAEDTLVEIYNHARLHAGEFDPREQTPLDWLIALARRFAVERARRSSPSPSPNTAGDLFQQNRRLANLALAGISEEQRSILEMTYLGGLTVVEVAELLGVSREYVTKEIVFGMRKLRTLSQNPGGSTIPGRSDLFPAADYADL